MNIFEAESPTNKKLAYFIFEDKKYDETAVAMMYYIIIKELFEKNPKLLIENQDVFKMTRNKNDFRSPTEITNGYYVEFNIDSRSKFGYLKKLLSLFDMEDELTIKYTDQYSETLSKNRHRVRYKYWSRILKKIEGTTPLFENIKPSKDHWLSCGAGKTGVSFTMVISKSFARIELTLSNSKKELNKKYFEILAHNKETIEDNFGDALEWEKLPDSKMSRIKYEIKDVNLFNEDTWEEMDSFFIDYLPKFGNAFESYIKSLS